MKVFSLIWGVIAFVGFCIGLLPCVGWFNWLVIPFALLGVVIAIVALATSRDGGSGPAIGGLILSAVAAVLGLIRLIIGGGIV